MNAEQELKEVLGHLKNLVVVHEEMGLDPPPVPKELDTRPESGPSREKSDAGQVEQADSLDALRSEIGDCRRCRLHKGRTRLVFGEGPARARLVFVGRVATAAIVVVACLWSPVILAYGAGVFKYIQEIWGFITPGIVAVFLVGLIVKQTPALAADRKSVV